MCLVPTSALSRSSRGDDGSSADGSGNATDGTDAADGSNTVYACCGSQTRSTIRKIQSGVGVTALHITDPTYGEATGIWTLPLRDGREQHAFIVVSYPLETRVLVSQTVLEAEAAYDDGSVGAVAAAAVEEGGDADDSVVLVEYSAESGFNLESSTLLCGTSVGGLLVQVTEDAVRVALHGTFPSHVEWKPAGDAHARITVAAVSGAYILVAVPAQRSLILLKVEIAGAGAAVDGQGGACAGTSAADGDLEPRSPATITVCAKMTTAVEPSCACVQHTLPQKHATPAEVGDGSVPPPHSEDDAVVCILGTYDGTVQIMRVGHSVGGINEFYRVQEIGLQQHTEEEIDIPETVLVAGLAAGADCKLSLFVGMRDGAALVFPWLQPQDASSSSGGGTAANQVEGMDTEEDEKSGVGGAAASTSTAAFVVSPAPAMYRCGSQPVKLVRGTKGSLISLSNRPGLFLERHGRLVHTPLAFGAAPFAAALSGQGCGDTLLLISDAALYMLQVEHASHLSVQPVVGTPHLGMQFTRVTHDPATGFLVALATQPTSARAQPAGAGAGRGGASGSESMTAAMIVVIDTAKAAIVGQMPLEVGEQGLTVISAELGPEAKPEQQQQQRRQQQRRRRQHQHQRRYICIGTVNAGGAGGRILVCKLSSDGALSLVCALDQFDAPVYCAANYDHKYLLLGVAGEVQALAFVPPIILGQRGTEAAAGRVKAGESAATSNEKGDQVANKSHGANGNGDSDIHDDDDAAAVASPAFLKKVSSVQHDADITSISTCGAHFIAADLSDSVKSYVVREGGRGGPAIKLIATDPDFRGVASTVMLSERLSLCCDLYGSIYSASAEESDCIGAAATPAAAAAAAATVGHGKRGGSGGAGDVMERTMHFSIGALGRCICNGSLVPLAEMGVGGGVGGSGGGSSKKRFSMEGEGGVAVVGTADGSLIALVPLESSMAKKLFELINVLSNSLDSATAPCAPLLGHLHDNFRSQLAPAEGVVDGDMVSEFLTLDTAIQQQTIVRCTEGFGKEKATVAAVAKLIEQLNRKCF